MGFRLITLKAGVASTWLAATSCVVAQPADEVVKQVVDAYTETCGVAFTDPSRYLETLQIPGPSGERVVTRTPDGQIVWVTTSHDDLLEDVQMAGVPGTLQITCVLTKTMTTPITNGPDLAQALTRYVGTLSDVVLVGGDAPQDQPLIVFGGNGVSPVGDSHVFAASGLITGVEVVTQIEAHSSYFAVSGLHRMGSE